MDRKTTLERYDRTMELRNLSPKTKHIYVRWLERFFDYIDFTDSDEVTLFQAQDYLHFILSSGQYATRTYNGAVYALRQFFEAIQERSVTDRQLPKIRPEKTTVGFFTGEQARILIKNCKDLQLKAAIALAYNCGLRINEVTSLQFRHIDKPSRTLTIELSKGNKTRYVHYDAVCADILNHYYLSLGLSQARPDYYLFHQKKKPLNKMKNPDLANRFSDYIEAFDFCLPIHTFHSLRHGFATELSMKGVPLPVIQQKMGHASAATTANYIHLPDTWETVVPDILEDQDTDGRREK